VTSSTVSEYSKLPATIPSEVGQLRAKPPMVMTVVLESPSVSLVLPTRVSVSVVFRPTDPAGAVVTVWDLVIV